MKDPTPLDSALDALPDNSGTIEIDQAGATTEVDVVDVDRLGVRLKGVRVRRTRAIDVEHEAATLPDRLRALPGRVEPVEIDPSLGGARLRTRPDRREYFEIDVEPDRTDIRRTRIDAEGTRHASDWAMTRDQLDRLLGEAAGPVDGPDEDQE
ncbi:MAG TPA: hypothetical protein ENK18_04630 [Deltaproteobacteria bacterium]|nr:hypothetical protein [Deltaproteobacteria bacterium]